jgi:hypothetical protein
MTGGVESFDLHNFRLIEQDAIWNDLGVEASVTEFLSDVFGGLAVLGRGGQVRLGCEDLEVLPGKLGVGDREELFFDLGLGSEVGVSEGCWPGSGLPGGFG